MNYLKKATLDLTSLRSEFSSEQQKLESKLTLFENEIATQKSELSDAFEKTKIKISGEIAYAMENIENHVNTDFDYNESKLTNAHQKSIEFRKSYDEVCLSK